MIAPINYVPSDLMLGIFSYLPPKDLCVAAKVCKKWNELASKDILWKSEASSLIISQVVEGRMKFQVLKERKISYFSENSLLNQFEIAIFQQVPKWRKIIKFATFDVTTPLVAVRYFSQTNNNSYLFVFRFIRDHFRFLKAADAANQKMEYKLWNLNALFEKAIYKTTLIGKGRADFAYAHGRFFFGRQGNDFRLIGDQIETRFFHEVQNLFFPKNPF